MKKLLALLLVLATFLTSAGFLSFFRGKVTDPVLAPAEGVTLPAGRLTALGDGHVLSSDFRGAEYAVVNLANGRSTGLTLREEDLDTWKALFRAEYEKSGTDDMPVEDYLLLLEHMGLSLPIITSEFHIFNVRGRYAECYTDAFNVILDWKTAQVLPMPELEGVIGLTHDGQVLTTGKADGKTVLSLYGLDGTPLRSAAFDFSAYPYQFFDIVENGVVATLCGNKDMASSTAPCALVFIDREFNASAPVELGPVRFLTRFKPYRSGTGKILLASKSLSELLVLDPDHGSCSVVAIDRNGASVRPFAQGMLTSGTGLTAVNGFAEDGSYALLANLHGGLYKLDLTTLALTQQMTLDELEAAGLSPIDANMLQWDGGEYAVTYNKVFTVKNK